MMENQAEGKLVKMWSCGYFELLVSPLIMENQMEKKMENEMEPGII